MFRIKINSKDIKKDDIFICIHDIYDDRHKYIKDAIHNKASSIITDKEINIKTRTPLIQVNNTNETYYKLLNNYYNNCLDNIKITGITGTDGKTTTANITKQLLNNFFKTAYLGTNGFEINNKKFNTNNTTPPLEKLFYYGKYLNTSKCNNLIMETSSEGLLHNRCYNIKFDYAILTNITKDHLNVHKSFNNYLQSKLILFKQVKKDGISILNIDDKYYKLFKRNCKNKTISYGTKKTADYYFYNIKLEQDKTKFVLKHKKRKYEITSPLLGLFNIYNLVAAIALVNSYGISIEDIITKINNLKQIDGRLEHLNFNQDYSIVLDYAHTVFATEQVLQFFNKIKKEKIITVVGCAGGRYTEKRKDIGKIVTTYSDKVIFTMDDPRYEKVSNIINEMTSQIIFNNYEIIEDRKKAIFKALSIAKKNDIVLILGKGRDSYMAIKDKYIYYNDFEVVEEYFKKLS